MYFPIFIDLSDREILMIGGRDDCGAQGEESVRVCRADYGRGTGGM